MRSCQAESRTHTGQELKWEGESRPEEGWIPPDEGKVGLD